MRQQRHPNDPRRSRVPGLRRPAFLVAFVVAVVAVVSLLSAARPEPAKAGVVGDAAGFVWDQTGGRVTGALGDVAGGMVGDWATEAMSAILQMLFGGLQAKVTERILAGLLELPDFTGGNVGELVGTTQAIAFGLLTAVLTITVLRYFFLGFGTGGSGFEPAQAVMRVLGACAAVIVWPTAFSYLIDLENAVIDVFWGMPSVQDDITRLWGTFNVVFATTGGGMGIGWFMGILVAIASMILIVGLVLMKVVITASTVFLFAGMPLAFILWPIPELAWVVRFAMRALITMLLIPVLWTTLFAATAAIGVDTLSFKGGGDLIDKTLIKPLVGVALLYVAFVLPKHLMRAAALGAPTPGGGFISHTASYMAGRQLGQAAQPHIPQWAGGRRGGPTAAPVQRQTRPGGATFNPDAGQGSRTSSQAGGVAAGAAAAGAAGGAAGAAAAGAVPVSTANGAASAPGLKTSAGESRRATSGAQDGAASGAQTGVTPTAAPHAAVQGQTGAPSEQAANGSTAADTETHAPAQVDYIPRDRNAGLLPVAANEQARQREMDGLAATPQPQHSAEQAMGALTPRMRQEVAAKAADAGSQRGFAAEMAHQATGTGYSQMESAAFRSLMRHDRGAVIAAGESLGNAPAGMLDVGGQTSEQLLSPPTSAPRTDVPLSAPSPQPPAIPGVDADGGAASPQPAPSSGPGDSAGRGTAAPQTQRAIPNMPPPPPGQSSAPRPSAAPDPPNRPAPRSQL